jgi:hypothetical protein
VALYRFDPRVWLYLGRVTFTAPLPDVLQETGAGRVALGMFGPLIAAVIMRLVAQDMPDWECRSHFFGVAAHLMRQILRAPAGMKAQ